MHDAALPAISPDLLPILGALALVLVGARLGAALMRRLGQPEVLGELLAGIAIGNLGWTGLGRDYAAVVAMVTLTTLIAPPLLAWRIRRSRSAAA